jgi:hypothetical protein
VRDGDSHCGRDGFLHIDVGSHPSSFRQMPDTFVWLDPQALTDWRRAVYHSRKYWTRLLVCALLVCAGIAWLIFGLYRVVGGIAIGSGVIALIGLLANRWALDHDRPMLHDWVPSRRAFLAPVGLLVVGVLLLVSYLGTRTRLRDWGCCSPPSL